jgi:hypothetical protein
MEVEGAGFDLHRRADQLHAVGIGLEESNVRMAVDRELRIWKRGDQILNFRGRNPWRGYHYVRGGLALQALLQFAGMNDRPHFGVDASAA